VCDDCVRGLEPKRIGERAVVAMAGIASDVLYGRNHSSPPFNGSWDKIYGAEDRWRPDIRKACCLDWMLDNLEKVPDLMAEYRTCHDPLTAISNLSRYQTPCRDCVGTYFEKAKELLLKPKMRRFVEELAESLSISSEGKLSRNECLDIWGQAGAEAVCRTGILGVGNPGTRRDVP
jgi:hypothetical protein